MQSPIRLSESLALLPSALGWILSGSRPSAVINQTSIQETSVHKISIQPSVLEEQVRQFWDLDSLGIKDSQERAMSVRDVQIMEEFHDSHCIDAGRRVVKFPWKEDVRLTSDNYTNAFYRLRSLRNRLRSNQQLTEIYTSHMKEYIDKGQVEIAPSTPLDEGKTYYLPHHAVKKEKNCTTKWRIVFDASSHTLGSPSLNDALEAGPNLLPEILAAILRFRTHHYALTADCSQAFLQLSLDEKDRDATRFLWFRTQEGPEGLVVITDEIITYRFCRLPFGLTCSPFLLSASLRELAAHHETLYPHAARQLPRNIFMDDSILGAETDDIVVQLHCELKALMAEIQIPLAKWTTNSSVLKQLWRKEGVEFPDDTTILGVNWNTNEDTLYIDVTGSTRAYTSETATKRHLLRAVSSLYDPLGLFSPVSMIGKILFQDTWLRGVQWDQSLPQDLAKRWQLWTQELPSLSSIQVSRCIVVSSQAIPSIHVFCDASERAYGAVLYLCSTQNMEVQVRLVCSRNRLAPIKKVTLPRLELLAALTGARLLQYFCKETDFDVTTATLWSDSTVSLCWIRNDPNRWKTFVCNRVTEIQRHTSPTQWRYCPGSMNPADHLSRGVLPEALSKCELWWQGPPWLRQPPSFWPEDLPATIASASPVPELRKPTGQILQVTVAVPSLMDASRYSSYI